MSPTLHAISNIIHIGAGSLALLGGMTALATVKGSRWHIRGGKVFVWTMIVVVVTTMIAMFNELLPLAIVLGLAEVYLVPSALLSVNRQRSDFLSWNRLLMILAGLLCLFSATQFVRVNLVLDQLVVGPLVVSVMFGFLFVQDWRMLGSRPAHPNFWLRRHLLRMILAFTVAVMALVRIGISFGLSLEATVVIPLAVAVLAIMWIYRRYPVSDSRDDGLPEDPGGTPQAGI